VNVRPNALGNVRGKFSFPDPTRPTKQQQNPPLFLSLQTEVEDLTGALTADRVPLAVRRQRVTNGSRRKRDLAAVNMAEELKRLEEMGECRHVAWEHLTPVFNLLWQSVPDSTFDIWLAPLQPAGAIGEILFLTAPEGICSWVKRRYSGLICDALRATGSGYTEVEFVSAGEGTTCR
jgi:hypothetical protein